MAIKDIIQTDDTNFIVEKKDNYSKIEVEIGDTKQEKFYPQAKLKCWDNECNFSIRYKDNEDGSYELNDNKVYWISKDKKKKVHMYELEGYEDGGFEIEVELLEKPSSNIIEYTLQTKEFNFFYQPELTQDQIDEGYNQPENVIGSYAVYHSTKKNNFIDKYTKLPIGNQYKTGKAFHIFRPEAVDSKGVKVWCELNIDEKNNLLNIIVPQDFLNNAIYPVVVDPTFGNTSVGSTSRNMNDDDAIGGKFTLSEDAVCESLTAYVCLVFGTSFNFKGCIWNDDGDPYSLVSNGVGGGASASTTAGWVTSTFGTNPQLTADDYYIGIVAEVVGFGTSCLFYSDFTGGSYGFDNYNDYDTPVALDPVQTGSNNYSVYVTYTAVTPTGWTYTINGITAANMAKVNDVAKADIDTINGV